MNRVPLTPPVIAPLAYDSSRPLWSVMIPVYNCAEFLPETLRSVLEQQLPEQDMQIEVVDDASTDADVEAIVAGIGKGRVKYFRQKENQGSLRNFETCINRAKGELVHLLHGDDKVRNGYYQKISQLFQQYPEAGAAFCRFSWIGGSGEHIFTEPAEREQDGILQNWLLRIGERNRLQYVAITVRREVYEKLGGFYGITYGEDWEMWVRIARHYPVAYAPEMLASYRKHTASISGQKFLSGQNVQDLTRTMELIRNYLPDEEKDRVLKESKKFYAHHAVHLANHIWHASQDKKSVKNQIQQALNLHHDLSIYWSIAKVNIKMKFNIL